MSRQIRPGLSLLVVCVLGVAPACDGVGTILPKGSQVRGGPAGAPPRASHGAGGAPATTATGTGGRSGYGATGGSSGSAGPSARSNTGGAAASGADGLGTGGRFAGDGTGGASAGDGTGGASASIGGSSGSSQSSADARPPIPADAAAPAAPTTRGGPPLPSAGCGKANPVTGARTIKTGANTANFIVTLPAGYDAGKPYPLGFAFHGYGLNEKTCAAGPECPGFNQLPAITVYPRSLGPGWEDNPTPLVPNLQFFADLLALVKAEYCVDEDRVFVAGVSSGGQFVEHLACKFGDQLWAVAPIAAYVDAGVDTGCKGTPAQIIIHGITDHLADHAHPVRDLYVKRNGCPSAPPGVADAESKMMAAFTAKRAEYACVDYPGCAQNAVRYCVSSQITYDGLTHGWPQVGGQLIGEFLKTLR